MLLLALTVALALLVVRLAIWAVSESDSPESAPVAPAWRAVREVQQRAVEAMLATELHTQQHADRAEQS